MTEDQLELETLGWLQDVGYHISAGRTLHLTVQARSEPITGKWSCHFGCGKPSIG